MLGLIIGDIKNNKKTHFPQKCLSYSILTTLTVATMCSLIYPINRKDAYKLYVKTDKLHSIPLMTWSLFNKEIKNPKINNDTLLRICPLVMKYSNYNILYYETNTAMELFNVSRSNIDLCNTLTRLLYDIRMHTPLDEIKDYINTKHCNSSLELTYYKTFQVLFKSNSFDDCIEQGIILSNDKHLYHNKSVLPIIYTLAELYYDTIPIKEYEILNRVLPNRYKLLIKNFYCRYASCRFITNDIITHLVTH